MKRVDRRRKAIEKREERAKEKNGKGIVKNR